VLGLGLTIRSTRGSGCAPEGQLHSAKGAGCLGRGIELAGGGSVVVLPTNEL
jgi:hypothetical protein